MGAITSLFVRKVIIAAGSSIDASALLHSVGLDADAETDVAQMVSDSAYYDLYERIAHSIQDATDLPLRTGESMRCDDYGAFGLAWKTAPTLRDSIARAERYWRLLTSVSEYELRHRGSDAYVILHRQGERRLGMRLSNEATLASITSIIRQVSPEPFAPLEVQLKHPSPRSVAAHEAYFGCQLVWEADLDALLIPSEALSRANQMGDRAITRFLLSHLDKELERIKTESSLSQMVQEVVAGALSEGVPKVPTVARRLGLGERTLQRRLNDEGLSFQKLVDNTRRELAEGLLVQSDYSLAEIAYLTGFSEQSAFNRAFKRWRNQTPTSYREARPTA